MGTSVKVSVGGGALEAVTDGVLDGACVDAWVDVVVGESATTAFVGVDVEVFVEVNAGPDGEVLVACGWAASGVFGVGVLVSVGGAH